MARFDALEDHADDKPPWQTCGVRWIVEDICTPADAPALKGAIDNPRVPASRIESAVRVNLGKRLPLQTVLRHRRGECGCPR